MGVLAILVVLGGVIWLLTRPPIRRAFGAVMGVLYIIGTMFFVLTAAGTFIFGFAMPLLWLGTLASLAFAAICAACAGMFISKRR